jgi:hypothetical protein
MVSRLATACSDRNQIRKRRILHTRARSGRALSGTALPNVYQNQTCVYTAPVFNTFMAIQHAARGDTMFTKMTQALILTVCLAAAGTASATDRTVIVPVIAGAAVGAVLATAISSAKHDHAPRHSHDRPRYRPVAYVPVAPRVEYRRVAPPPRHYYRGDRYRGNAHDHRHFDDHRRW